MDLLTNRTCVVFGGQGNLGSVIVTHMFEQGANVVINYYNGEEEAAQKRAAELDPSGQRVLAVYGDVTSEASMQTLMEQVMAKFGRVDIAVNSVHVDFDVVNVEDMTDDTWRVHLIAMRGHAMICKHVIPVMRRQKYGRIIYLAAALGFRYMGGCAPFATVKSGLTAFCRTMACEVGPDNITVNIVAPGRITDTKSQQDEWDDIANDLLKRTPMGRFATPDEVADTAVFFASPLANAMTGQILFVACGEIMQ